MVNYNPSLFLFNISSLKIPPSRKNETLQMKTVMLNGKNEFKDQRIDLKNLMIPIWDFPKSVQAQRFTTSFKVLVNYNLSLFLFNISSLKIPPSRKNETLQMKQRC